MYVVHRYEVPQSVQDKLRSLTPKFGYNGFGEILFYRTYSRKTKEGKQETWADLVIRVTSGCFSIRKDFYIKNNIPWDEEYWNNYAADFALSMFHMQWLPPGRGCWAMGTDFVYERGAMSLYNCAYTDLRSGIHFTEDAGWLMDSLMNGVGVGFAPLATGFNKYNPKGKYDFIIPDTREGWVDSVKALLRAYMVPNQKLPVMVYDRVRPAGFPIKGFGGIASGPEPLKRLHEELIAQFDTKTEEIIFKTNVANLIGCCVVAGNVRRSAEIACGSVRDKLFLDLKNYKRFPEREAFGWMSNNSCILENEKDFDQLGEIARRVLVNGEPGAINKKNLPFARIGKSMKGLRFDHAIGFNPCGEIPLEHREVCNLAETFPTVCETEDDWYKSCGHAAFYCSTVSLLPTHQPETNKVVGRNRRIGVGIVDFTGWKHVHGVHKVTRFLRNGYNVVRETNRWANGEAGVPEAIRVTTVKPGGTIPKLPGRTSGLGHPTFHHTIRRVRVQENSPIDRCLRDANVPFEKDYYSQNTIVFEYPILQGPAKPAEEVTLWEQASNLVLLQREWSDNAVSNTLYFKPKWRLAQVLNSRDVYCERELQLMIGTARLETILKNLTDFYEIENHLRVEFEYHDDGSFDAKVYDFDPKHEENDVEPVLSSIIPIVKSVSLLPHTAQGVYKQMPEEGISKSEYESRLAQLKPIDWSKFSGSDGEDERYCTGDACELGGSTK